MTPDLDLDAAIRRVFGTVDAEGWQGDLNERAERLQVNARAIANLDEEESFEQPKWAALRQRRAAREYEAARDAFLHAYRFEKAMEVLRGR